MRRQMIGNFVIKHILLLMLVCCVRQARRALGDFGVPIAIVLMVGVSVFVPVYTEKLRVPDGLSPTSPRSWLVPLNPGIETIPAWVAFAMALPALMVYIIVFMETHIAE